MIEECCHAVGTATVEYHLDILHAGDSVNNAHEHSFEPFRFCPYCGKPVESEAAEVAARIQDKWEKFWQWYGEQHGVEELKRARKITAEIP